MRKGIQWLNQKFVNYWTKELPTKRPYISDFDNIAHNIRPGDIILENGRTRASSLVRRMTQSPWSHVSLYLGRLHDIESAHMRQIIINTYNPDPQEGLVFESVLGKGNYIDNISVFKQSQIRLLRPYQISHEDIQSVLNYAISHIGADYNVRHFLDLGRFLLASRLFPRRWRSSLFDQESGQAKQQICSGMIAKAFMSVRYPILPLVRHDDPNKPELIHRNPNLFVPADFDYSPYFKIIKFPKFHAHETPVYHHLPWNDEYMSNDDIGITESLGNFQNHAAKIDATNKTDYHESIND